MKDNLISVVISVYNVEKYIEKCINSILQQTYKHLEVICINDGSTDNSKKILEEFQKKDSRIKIITKQNEGLLKSRVDGLKISKGKYIVFIDGDDWIEINMIEKMYNKIIETSADIVRSNYYINDSKKMMINKEELLIDKASFEPLFFDFFYKTTCCNSAWRQMINKECIKDIEDINTDITLGEDIEFNLHIYPNIKKISFIPDCLYHYRRDNINSITTNPNIEKIKNNIKSSLKAHTRLYQSIERFDINDKERYRLEVLTRIIREASYLELKLLWNTKRNKLKEVHKFLKQVNNSEELENVRKNLTYKQLNFKTMKYKYFVKSVYKKDYIRIYVYYFVFYRLGKSTVELIRRILK